ncbi:hypothetical protein ACFWBX_12530 [Streptomyces sp. NPDC059991]|uniref:hypothetical protein n=1 Tax=Streptomyces sp. NPDC059991 TaxID=3347028 RepID=UPI003694179C
MHVTPQTAWTTEVAGPRAEPAALKAFWALVSGTRVELFFTGGLALTLAAIGYARQRTAQTR